MMSISAGRVKALANGDTIVTIPVGYRPNSQVQILDIANMYRLAANTDGTLVAVSPYNANTMIRASAIWIIGG